MKRSTFDGQGYSGVAVNQAAKRGDPIWRSERLARQASWTVAPLSSGQIDAMLLARDVLFVAGSTGELVALSAANGSVLNRVQLSAPAWDGMAAGKGRLFLSARDGQLLCLQGDAGN